MYHLQKYRTNNDRHECPNCHKKHSFTWYVDDDGQPIDPTCGKCNHENSCGYHYPPREYFADHPTDRKPMGDRPKQEAATPLPMPKPLCTLPFDYVIKSASYNSSFVRFLHGLFGAGIVHYLMALYALGATHEGDVIFWQIDKAGRVHGGKIVKFYPVGHPKFGHRDKEDEYVVTWVHPKLKRLGLLPDDWELTQCLFGEHLLNLSFNKEKTIALVESEKSAMIGAAVFPQYVWLATGGKHNLQYAKTKSLAGRKVIMFPDTDTKGETFKLWQTKATEIAKFCKVTVSNRLEREATPEQKEKGIDIADWLVDEIQSGALAVELTNEMQTVIMREQHPIINTLIQELKLKPDP